MLQSSYNLSDRPFLLSLICPVYTRWHWATPVLCGGAINVLG